MRYCSPELVPTPQPALDCCFWTWRWLRRRGVSSLSRKRTFRYSSGASGEVRVPRAGPCVTAAVRGSSRPDQRSPLSVRSSCQLFRGSCWSSGRDFWASRRGPAARLHRLRKACIIELKTLPVLVYPDRTLWVLLLQQLSGGKFNANTTFLGGTSRDSGAEHLCRNRWKQTQMRPDPKSQHNTQRVGGGPFGSKLPRCHLI